MDDLKFDIYAMVNPKTPKDVKALLDEALSLLDDMNKSLDKLFKPDTKEKP